MSIFLYSMLFIMGTFFGSFLTLAVYRIPLKMDITHEHSFCPNCKHKLGMFDLIPVWSYVFLKGKCRYCGQKVRIRYLLLEILSGLVFVIAFASLNIQDIFEAKMKIIDFIAFVFMYITVVLVAGIDKEYKKINASILLFGVFCQIGYILYLYIVGVTSMYRYIIYLLLFTVILFLQKKKKTYLLQILLLISYLLLVFDFKLVVIILMMSFLLKPILKENAISMGFVMGFSTIVCAIVENFIKFWII